MEQRISTSVITNTLFLVADTRLYTLPCRSVGRSVRRSVHQSVTFLNSGRFLHYCSCPTVRDWISVYPALFLSLFPVLCLLLCFDTFCLLLCFAIGRVNAKLETVIVSIQLPVCLIKPSVGFVSLLITMPM